MNLLRLFVLGAVISLGGRADVLPFVSIGSASERPLLAEVASKSRRPAGTPRLSAVCFSSRWIHPRNAQDPWDTFEVAAAFHATNFVWTYSLDQQAVGRMKKSGGKVYLAINSLLPDEPGKNERLQEHVWAERRKIKVTLVANQRMRTPRSEFIDSVLVQDTG